MKLLFPDALHRSPTTVVVSFTCACCEKRVSVADENEVGRYFIVLGNERFDYCVGCAACLRVVLPMVKTVRQKSLEGAL